MIRSIASWSLWAARVARTAQAAQPMRKAATCPSRRLQRSTFRGYATATTAASTPIDPVEVEAQRLISEGSDLLAAGELGKAKEAYEKSNEIRESASALYNLGVVQYHSRELEDAIKSWNRSLELSPDSPDAHTNLASAHVMSKPSRPDLAVQHLKTAATLSPNDPEIAYNLGAVLEACEQLEEALKAYKLAFDGGIQRAEENVRNTTAKILAAQLANAEEDEGKKGEGL